MGEHKPRPHQKVKPLFVMGRKAVLDALNQNVRVNKVFLMRPDAQIVHLCSQTNTPYELRSAKWIDSQTAGGVHQGVLAEVDVSHLMLSPEALLAKVMHQPCCVIVLLDQIHDPHNFGAILRTALAAKAAGVIYRADNQVQLSTAVIKASAGAALQIPLVRVANLRYVVDKFCAAGFWHVVSCLDDQAQDYRAINVDKMLLTLGSEETGVSPLLLKEADFKVKIPLASTMESLNVSVAAGILLFHYLLPKLER